MNKTRKIAMVREKMVPITTDSYKKLYSKNTRANNSGTTGSLDSEEKGRIQANLKSEIYSALQSLRNESARAGPEKISNTILKALKE